jgi:hypothetical protein
MGAACQFTTQCIPGQICNRSIPNDFRHGDLWYAPGSIGDQRQWYTSSFGGTSSATPLVAGAICAVGGYQRALRGQPLLLRQLLGYMSVGGSTDPAQKIGARINVKRSIDLVLMAPVQPVLDLAQ